MANAKCSSCSKARGRRDCLLKEGALICSVCCAGMRSEETCSECSHFVETQQHEKKVLRKKRTPSFLFELNPELEKEIDGILLKIENGKFEEIAPRVDVLLTESPHSPLVHYAKGCFLAKQNDELGAIPYFEEAVRINPNFLEAWVNLSLSSVHLMKLSRAVEAAREVTELDRPGSPIYAKAKGLLMKLNKAAQNEGISLKNYLEASVYFNDAFDLMDQEDFEGAREGFSKSRTLNPSNPSTYGNLGLCYAYLGEKTLALEMIDKALEIDSGYKPARDNRSAIEKLKDGEALSGEFRTINHALERLQSDT